MALVGGGSACAKDATVRLGRQIFEQGVGRDGREVRGMTAGNTVLTGTDVACVGCHGETGRGGRESFVSAPDIRWSVLSKPFRGREPGRSAIPYSRESFARTIRTGIGSDGGRLDGAMPKFDLANDEVEGLIHFLAAIDRRENLNARRLSFVSLIPKRGSIAIADQLATGIRTCSERMPKITFSAIDQIEYSSPEDALNQLGQRRNADGNQVVIAPFIIGWENEYFAYTSSRNIVSIIPFSLFSAPRHASRFTPFAGIEKQIEALIQSVIPQQPRVVRVHYQESNVLSVRLYKISKTIGKRFRVRLESANESADNNRQDHVHLYLMPRELVPATQSGARAVHLVPAIYANQADDLSTSNGKAQTPWRVSFPYPPGRPGSRRWRTPVEAWTDAACDLLRRSSDPKFAVEQVKEVVSDWKNEFRLNAKRTGLRELNEVYLVDDGY